MYAAVDFILGSDIRPISTRLTLLQFPSLHWPIMYLRRDTKAASAVWLLLNGPTVSTKGGLDIAQVEPEYAYRLPSPTMGT